ncbi:dihydrofolate reductase family protein [Actinokineospora cianjurensis]|uniref:Dihydrofolate reductase n=1 Tax=Actinokineospora cianjurensis TaxID=585224 RepID=A0A421B343_9PSEU|nr:dihydrofolate reductase family protein [Actinokineospora cianjurensis]RLK58799.1 dihydrofolate reductase [Actinokineospora cianjurensis]
MKLTITTQVSVDGVMQGNGGRHPDLDPGFERGGWARPLFSPEGSAYVASICRRADAFLFGRRTYELFAGYWGTMAPGSGPIADAFNTRPKYLASTTVTEPGWADTTVLSGDLATAVKELKDRGTGELQVHGSGVLARWLLENDLVDELSLIVMPVVVGEGTRLFPAAGRDIALELVDSRVFPTGAMAQVYRLAGRPRYVTD